jgi:hypothetical protein
MERIEVDGHLLQWQRQGSSGELAVHPLSDGVPAPGTGTSFRFAVREDRLLVELALLPIARTVDVSLQPDLLRQVLPIGHGPCRPGTAGSTVARWVVSLLEGTRAWRPADPDRSGLMATVGGAAFPLLGNAYDRGAAALCEIPRWAGPVLAGATPRDGARAGFGPKATRTVARTLVEGLMAEAVPPPPGVTVLVDGGPPGSGRIDLFRLAMALMADASAEPDRIARLLCTSGPPHPPERWPGGEQIAAGRALAIRLGPAGIERVLADAVAREDGSVLLDEICRLVPGVVHLLPARPAHRLEDLRDQCRALLPIDPDPGAGGWSRTRGRRPVTGLPTRRAPVRPVVVGRPPVRAVQPRFGGPSPRPDPRRRMHVAPAAPALAPSTRLMVSTRAAALHGVEVGDGLRIVLPRSTDELAEWGRALRNCVGSFGPAVAAGRSLLFGVEVHDVLAYCLEIAPDGGVRQFLGERNRPVPPAVAGAVCRHLVEAGMLQADRSVNQVWLEA